MKKSRIVFGVAVAFAAGALAVGAFATGAVRQHGGQVAAKVDELGKNSAQEMLCRYIVGAQTSLLNETKDPDARNQIIMATNYYILATMTPAEQKAYKRDVLQVEKYQPGGDWNKALAAPTMLNELLRIPSGQVSKLAAIVAETDEAVSNIISAPGFFDLPQDQRRAKLEASRREVTQKFLGALTPSQRTEWNRFVAMVDADLSKAARGIHVAASK